ncbi:hypothetical protein B0T09DRAFT_175137 [Sordaria sp. MPI-SDFR-AT-0083]|nr:hypothetical protein B0T09DRAFT_175137 [Sordaria sp. MPI-SDFR-AT-0083]
MTKRALPKAASSQEPRLPYREPVILVKAVEIVAQLMVLSAVAGFLFLTFYISRFSLNLVHDSVVSASEILRTSSLTPIMTMLNDWENISSDGKGQGSEYPKTDIYMGSSDADPSPAYQEADNMFPHCPNQSPRLVIIGATWGGVSVTDDIRAMVASDDSITFDMYNLHKVLTPDPAYGTVKTLTVLFQFEGLNNNGGVHLINIPEHTSILSISADKHADPKEQKPAEKMSQFAQTINRPWRTGLPYNGSVEILAALYGPERIETPSVLQELAKFFEGRRGQIRMTNAFWKKDTWPGVRKSWTVYFRFADSKRIQVVTGMEDGALEVPWGRF